MSEHYILEGKTAVPCDMMTWATWFERNRETRIVAKTTIRDVRVSTVFLGLNHAFTPTEPPQIFETMVFGGPLDQEQERYSSYREAESGHKAMCERVERALA